MSTPAAIKKLQKDLTLTKACEYSLITHSLAPGFLPSMPFSIYFYESKYNKVTPMFLINLDTHGLKIF